MALLVAAVVGVLLIGGCGLRTPSGIRIDQRSVDTSADEPDIRELPPGPVPGASPAEIVAGFLEAAAADPDHTIAQEFLAPEAVWADSGAATVYDPETLSALKVTKLGTLSRVTLTARSLGQVATGGAFLPVDRPISASYGLRFAAGQWRLSSVPPGVLLTPRDLARAYRPVTTYNYNENRSLLVAEPGYVVSDRAGLAGAALHALLTNWGGEGKTSGDPFRGLPSGLTALGSVVVTNGEATVDLGHEAFNVPQARRPMLVSQIAASLGSVPGVFTVRVLVEERPYIGGAVPATIPADLATTSSGPAFGIGPDGGLVTVSETGGRPTTRAVPWQVSTTVKPSKSGKTGAVARTTVTRVSAGLIADPVAAPGGGQLAVRRLAATGQQLVLADLDPVRGLRATQGRVIALKPAVTTRYLAPQWVDAARLLLASSTAGVSSVELIDASNGAVHPVSAPGLAALGTLSSFTISRDGTRVIAVAGPVGARRVYLGRISQASSDPARADDLVVDGWIPVPTGMADVDAVSWAGDLSVAVVGQPASSGATLGPPISAAETVALDTVADPVQLPILPPVFTPSAAAVLPVTVTTAQGRPTLIAIGGNSWILRANEWVELRPPSAVADVSYP